MTNQESYPAGAPCWVDTLQVDPRAATRFYGPLFGWSFDEPVPMPDGLIGDYFAARIGGRLVTGIGQAPRYLRLPGTPTFASRTSSRRSPMLIRPEASCWPARWTPVRLADSTGVPFCVWQAGRRIGAELAGAPNTWATSSLHTTNPQCADAFYDAVFGWTLEPVADAALSQWRLADRVAAVVSATDGVTVPPH